jgi:hypothetical protein
VLHAACAASSSRSSPLPANANARFRDSSREFEAFLRCGVLAHGFVRVHCDACGLDRVVALS